MRYFILLSIIITYSFSIAAQPVVEKPELIAESNSEDLTHVMDLDFMIYENENIQFFIADVFQSTVLLMKREDKSIVLTNRLGRSGEGPGEFSDITNLQLISEDELMVYDRNLVRLSIFNINNHADFKTFKIDPEKSAQFPMDFFAGGTSTFYARTDQYFSDDYDPNQKRISILQKYNSDGQFETDSLFIVPADEAFVLRHKDIMSVKSNPIWGKKSIFRFTDDRIYYAWGGKSQIEIYNTNGVLIENIELTLPQREILKEDQDEIVAHEINMMEHIEKSVIRKIVL